MKKFPCIRTGCRFNKKGYCEHPNPERETKDGFTCYSFEPDNNERRGR